MENKQYVRSLIFGECTYCLFFMAHSGTGVVGAVATAGGFAVLFVADHFGHGFSQGDRIVALAKKTLLMRLSCAIKKCEFCQTDQIFAPMVGGLFFCFLFGTK